VAIVALMISFPIRHSPSNRRLVTRRHHISPNGFYRGKKVIETKKDEE